MSSKVEREVFEDSLRTLGVVTARHIVSEQISLGWLKDSNLLTEGEVKLCIKHGMVLPQPERAELGGKCVSPDLWNIRVVDNEIREGKTVYVLTGVFDVFTGGHWWLISQACQLASENNGVLVARIESDEYVREWKGHEPVFPVEYRLGWFKHLPVKWITYFPTSRNSSQSWDFGNQLLTGGPEGINMEKALIFVLPVSQKFSEDEKENLDNRARQIREYGFGVIRVQSDIGDVSSTVLREKFQLRPVRGI